ncbi:MAG TPA: Flp pilus assembly protein CpaB [Acidobacteriaceae bacterium]|nr:Flp pilus assembly protein CpaB [Acidobacteriaceae bacterium]
MIKRRLSSAFLVALLVSGGCTYLLSRKMKLQHAVVVTQGYVAAAAPLNAGEVLAPGKLKMVQWPVSVPLEGAYLKPQDLVGRSLLYPLAAGAPILDRDLAIPGTGLTTKIPDGMRALALRSDEVVGVAGFLFPGSHVDVLVTYRSTTDPEPATATVVQNVEVVAAGNQVQPNLDGKPSSVNVVTVLVTPMDAERVVLASTQGTIHFVLRNSEDHGQVDDPQVGLAELIPGAGAAPVSVKHAVRAVVIRRAPREIVETVIGNKQSRVSF